MRLVVVPRAEAGDGDAPDRVARDPEGDHCAVRSGS